MSDILSTRIHEGGDVSEKEMIVLPKGTTIYAPGTVGVHTTGPVCEVNVSIGGLSDKTIEELVRRTAEMIRKRKLTPPDGEIHLG